MGCALVKTESTPVFELKHAGVSMCNGWWRRDGTANGWPKYKHCDRDLWTRRSQGGGWWILVPRDLSACMVCIYKVRVDPSSPTLPPTYGWQLGRSWTRTNATKDGWFAVFASIETRQPPPNALDGAHWHEARANGFTQLSRLAAGFELRGAGCEMVNGRYQRDGLANGAPKYRHEQNELWIRHSKSGMHWVVTPRDGDVAWTTLYSVLITHRCRLQPPASGWSVDANFSPQRAEKDGWTREFERITVREPPPGAPVQGVALPSPAPIVVTGVPVTGVAVPTMSVAPRALPLAAPAGLDHALGVSELHAA